MMRWLRVPAVLITASLALGIGLIELKRSVDGRRKIAVAGLMADAPRHDLSIRLSVPPEQFHMHRLQRWGVMVDAQGQVVRLRNVPAQELPTIARQPWVAALSPLAGS